MRDRLNFLGLVVLGLVIFSAVRPVRAHSVATCIYGDPCSSGSISVYAGSYHSAAEMSNVPVGGLLVRPTGSGLPYTRYNFQSLVSVAGTLPPGVPASACSFPCSGYTAASIATWQLGTTGALPGGNYDVTTTSDTIYETPIGTCLDSVIAVSATGSITCDVDRTFAASDPSGSCSALIGFNPPTTSVSCPGATVTTAQTSGPASGTTLPIGNYLVQWRMDINGNPAGSCQHSVTVRDSSTPPLLQGCNSPPNTPCQPGTGGGARVNYAMPTASDCSSFSLFANPPPGALFPMGTTSALVTALDSPAYGGSPTSSACSFPVTVFPAVAPVLPTGSCPQGQNVPHPITDPDNNRTVIGYPVPFFDDSCRDRRSLTSAYGPVPGDVLTLPTVLGYEIPVGWTAADPYTGEQMRCSFNLVFGALELNKPQWGLRHYMYVRLVMGWRNWNLSPADLAGEVADVHLRDPATGLNTIFANTTLAYGTGTFTVLAFYGVLPGPYDLGLISQSGRIAFTSNWVRIVLITAAGADH